MGVYHRGFEGFRVQRGAVEWLQLSLGELTDYCVSQGTKKPGYLAVTGP